MKFRMLVLLPALAGSLALAADIALQVTGMAGRDGVVKPAVSLNAAALAALPRTKVTIQDHLYEGVALHEILKHAGQPMGENLRGPVLSRFAMTTAHDGYRAIFSLPEIDPGFGNNGALVADAVDGHPLEGKQAPLSIVVPGEKLHSRWVYGLEKIEVMAAPDPVR